MNELEELKQIVNGDGFDADDRTSVIKLEEALQEAIAAENLSLHPVIKNYLDWLYKEITDCKELLSSELERLDAIARDRLFERIRSCKQTLRAFGGDKADIEAHIKSLLETARKQ